MFKFLLKIFVKDYENTSDSTVRQRYGMLSGILGIVCNLFLFALKLTIGLILHSVAVISDAFNNLSDMGSTVISIAGIRLSSKKPDRDHPFGHGRFEYISALIVAFIIMLVGVELFKTSAAKIGLSNALTSSINWLSIGFLSFSIPIKLFMYGYNRYFGKKIDSSVLCATATDSLNDCIATGAVILSTIIDGLHLLPFAVDGIVGALVSLMILYAGFSVARDTIGLLLGKAPDSQLVADISQAIKSSPEILDIHDLIVHDYGPGRLFASVHAEVPDSADMVAAHEAIDAVEKQILHRFGCEITIHLDPVSLHNEKLEAAKECIRNAISSLGHTWHFHDVRMTDGIENINIIFDIVVPYETPAAETEKVLAQIKKDLLLLDPRYTAVIQIDRDLSNSL